MKKFISRLPAFLILMLILMTWLMTPQETRAQKFLRIDSVKTGDSVYSVEVTPYGPVYIDIFKSQGTVSAGTSDSLMLYIIPYGEPDSMQVSSMAENQITFVKDSLLIIPTTVTSRTWKVMDANVQTIKLKMVNDSANTDRLIKIIIRGLSDIRGSLLEDYYRYASYYAEGKITWSEFIDLYGGLVTLSKYPFKAEGFTKPEDFKLLSVYHLIL